MEYAELHVTSNFSFLRGASHPGEFVVRAAELKYRALALTDGNTLAGVVRGHVAAKELGIAYIPGCRISFCEEIPEKPEKLIELPLSLLLYPTSKKSYSNMSNLLTTGKLRAPKGQCYLTLIDLARFAEGLLGVAVIHKPFAPGIPRQLQFLKQVFDRDRLSVAISSNYSPEQKKRLRAVLSAAEKLSLPRVVTNEVYYHVSERRMLQDTLSCIRLGCTIQEAGFALFQNAERYLKPIAEIHRLWRGHPAALSRTIEIAERCQDFSLDQLRYEYPHEICPDGKAPQDHLRELVMDAAKNRYLQGVPEEILKQLEHELALIRELEYEKYFLTVHDIVCFARSRGILCQGRGAAANSAVCYVLGITAVDPKQVHLLFERFISKERNEPPDIDIDFEHERREEVIQYIYQKYGRLRAALTAEVVSYRTRSALRDIGKVFGLPIESIETMLKIKTRNQERSLPREKLLEHGLNPDIPAIEHTIRLSDTLRSFPRHLSQHVGGFIISDPPLSDIVPIENAAMEERTTIEWDKDDIEHLGMLKIDVLGLGILSCIRKAFDFVNLERKHSHIPLSLYTLPREDPAVYEMICRADTIGVFQIESRAQMTMLPRLRPKCFYDLVIEVAIVRPGPIQGGMVHPFLRRREKKEKVVYPSKAVERILERTLGVPIFQEQVMELSIVAAGFTPGEADELRRAMGSWKKSANALLKFERKLKDGMAKNGYAPEFAHQIFEQIKGFGEYGFPQSHAASFALLVYASAWLKHYFPAHFTAAMINSLPMGFYQPAQLVQDAKNHKVSVLNADVNHSSWDCTLEYPPATAQSPLKPALRLGLRMIRGLKREDMEGMISKVKELAAEHGRFSSIRALWQQTGVSVSQLRLLGRGDAFQSLGLDRQQSLWEIKKLNDAPLPLFEAIEEQAEEPVNLPALAETLEVLRDYETTGLSLKAHPVSFLRPFLDQHRVRTIAEFKESKSGSRMAIAGLVLVRQCPPTANGTLFITLEDETGMSNLILWSSVFQQFQDTAMDAVFLVAQGKLQKEAEVAHLIVETVIDISSAYKGMDSCSRDFH